VGCHEPAKLLPPAKNTKPAGNDTADNPCRSIASENRSHELAFETEKKSKQITTISVIPFVDARNVDGATQTIRMLVVTGKICRGNERESANTSCGNYLRFWGTIYDTKTRLVLTVYASSL
jgi:hypothetical protein